MFVHFVQAKHFFTEIYSVANVTPESYPMYVHQVFLIAVILLEKFLADLALEFRVWLVCMRCIMLSQTSCTWQALATLITRVLFDNQPHFLGMISL